MADIKPLAIAIIGRPNVGKSSLINSIMQSERAIVSELPGTTRDAIDIVYERGEQRFLFIDTAGIRRRGKHSSSVEVFSVMRAERSIQRADLCVLIVDLTSGVTAQDKRIAGLIQKAGKAAVVVLNKWDLIKPKRGEKQALKQLVDETRSRLFFLDYAPVLIASARTGENIGKLFGFIERDRARFACPHWNRRSQSLAAIRIRSQSTANEKRKALKIVLCRSSRWKEGSTTRPT